MAKTFKSVASEYVVSGMYFDRDKFTAIDFELTLTSKDKRFIRKSVSDEFGCKPNDINIAKIEKRSNVTTYRINASIENIIKACEEYGISVDIIDGDIEDDDANADGVIEK